MKKLVNLLLIVCMVFSVGCAGKQDVGEKSEVADEAETPVVQSHLIEIRKVIEDRDLYISLVHADTDFAGASRKTIKSSYGAGRFSVVDMDSDGEEEVVVEDKCSDIVVFHYEAGEVQYFKFPFRGMKRIKVDGTYESSYSAAVTVKKKLDFNDGMCVETHLCMYDGTDEEYTIDGIDVSPQEAMDYIDSSNEKQDVEWYEVNKKNLDRLGNIPAFEVEQVGEYSLEKSTFSEGKVKVEYPQIVGMDDADLQNSVNNTLKNEALKYVEELMDDENLASCEMNYKVHLKNGSLLSVQYFQDFYHEKAAHPTHKSFSTNIYLPESKIVRLTDIIDDRKVLANLLNEGKYKLGKYESKYEKDVLSSMYFYLGSTSSIANFEKADGIDFKTESDAYSYLTEDSLGIIIEVSYAAGGHISLEIKYSDIREMFKGNFGALVENYEVN